MHDLFFKIRFWLPCCWFASIPLGPSIQSILLVITLMTILMNVKDLHQIKHVIQHRWFLFLVLAVGYSLLSLIWTPATHSETIFYIKKHLDLLLIPILALGFQEEAQKDCALKGFLMAALIPMLVGIYLHLFHTSLYSDMDQGHIFYNHIITGFYSAIAAFISLQFFIIEKKRVYALAFLLFSFQCLFLNTGRFAYLLYFALLGLSIYVYIPKKYIVISLLLAIILLVAGIVLSPVIKTGISNFMQDIQKYQHGDKQSSLGFRLQFHAFAIQQFLHHPYFGNGIAGFDALFKHFSPVPSWAFQPNTHSQYLLFACDYGLLGLFFWGGFFYYLIAHLQQAPYLQVIFYGFMLALCLNFFTDNMLYASPGHLLMAFAALLYSPFTKKKP